MRLKRYNNSMNSVVDFFVVLSIWMLKSPRRRTKGKMAHSWVTKPEKSEKNGGGGGLRGTVDTVMAMTKGVGLESLMDMESKG